MKWQLNHESGVFFIEIHWKCWQCYLAACVVKIIPIWNALWWNLLKLVKYAVLKYAQLAQYYENMEFLNVEWIDRASDWSKWRWARKKDRKKREGQNKKRKKAARKRVRERENANNVEGRTKFYWHQKNFHAMTHGTVHFIVIELLKFGIIA